MAKSSEDQYARLFDPWLLKVEIAKADALEKSRVQLAEQEFYASWHRAYSTSGQSDVYEQIADQLVLLRDGILSRFWDFRLAELVSPDQNVAWKIAALNLWNARQDDKAAIVRGLRHTAELLNDIAIWHHDMLEVLKWKEGLPHTPAITQVALARLLGKKRYAINNQVRHHKLTTTDTEGNAKRWLHIDPEAQKLILLEFRKKEPQLIWPH